VPLIKNEIERLEAKIKEISHELSIFEGAEEYFPAHISILEAKLIAFKQQRERLLNNYTQLK
jgi:chromosome segregation ATPase